MAKILYCRTSSVSQSYTAQKSVFCETFDKEFVDEGVSGAIPSSERPAFSSLLQFVREGDEVYVFAVDRLGRDALDIQSVVRKLISMNVGLVLYRLGTIRKGSGELILAILAQLAEMERERIVERCAAGRAIAKDSIRKSGLTHRGKKSLGRPPKCDTREVKKWREENQASIAQTASNFNISISTVKRYCVG